MISLDIEGKDKIEVKEGLSFVQVLKDYDQKKSQATVAVRVNGQLRDLKDPVIEDARVELILKDSEEGLEILRHSSAHVMAMAVLELFPDAKLGIGPAIKDGFYYDFDMKQSLSEADLVKVEKRIKEIVKRNIAFEKKYLKKAEARELFAKKGEKYKVELIDELEADEVSVYISGNLVDLCRGPHLMSTGQVRNIKLLSVAGAYWRGSEKNPMLQRIYGTAFWNDRELKEYLNRRKEAQARDHRKLGAALELFSVSPEVGSGLILWHPKGAMLWHIIENFCKNEHLKNGYEFIVTPHIGRANLWRTSGHLDFYQENMYAPMNIENQDYYIKPMNCPFHIMIYRSRGRSYRELPLRWAEWGTVYRFERSGVLHGLMRVRGFTQDDAHIFCRADQLQEELEKTVNFSLHILRSFGFENFEVYLASRPEKYVGSLEDWARAEKALQRALEGCGLEYTEDPGGGVFYGPKVDIKIRDAIGRAWQCSTIQFDFNLAERFDLNYVGPDGKQHRTFMIHRALMGSMERFIGCLIEHYNGEFPFWLAPVQFKVMTIVDAVNDYALLVKETLDKLGYRVETDLRNEKIGYKIREARSQKIPYLVILGNLEKENRTVTVRRRDGSQLKNITIEAFVKKELKK